MNNDDYYMELAIKEAYKSKQLNEIPVGAIIVDRDGKIISKAHNNKENTNISIAHAEINAIIKANKKNKNWRLNNCIMYVTLEPCEMCKRVIEESRIQKVVYSSKNYNYKEFQCCYVKISNQKIINDTDNIINDSFRNIRNK